MSVTALDIARNEFAAAVKRLTAEIHNNPGDVALILECCIGVVMADRNFVDAATRADKQQDTPNG